MKRFFLLILSLISAFSLLAQEADSIIDIRDGQIYNIVKIGEQWWMAENLNVGDMIQGNQWPADDQIIQKYCYSNNPGNCEVYGALYRGFEILGHRSRNYYPEENIQGICPVGWFLPEEKDWNELIEFNGGASASGGKMKKTGTDYWDPPNTNATNSSGFSALPAGYLDNGEAFNSLGSGAFFTTATQTSSSCPDSLWHRMLNYNDGAVVRNHFNKEFGIAVRCFRHSFNYSLLSITDKSLKRVSDLTLYKNVISDTIVIINTSAGNSVNISEINLTTSIFTVSKSSFSILPGDSVHLVIHFYPPESGEIFLDTLVIQSNDPGKSIITLPLRAFNISNKITDIRDGQQYSIVKIGEQWWMKENLNIGNRIESSQNQVVNGIIEKYCYDNLEKNCDRYGGLYHWDEMMRYNPSDNKNPGITQGICPVGWHIPTLNEWEELVDFLGGEAVAGGKLKECGTVLWSDPNTGATNESEFTAIPGGSFNLEKSFSGLGHSATFWLSTAGESSGDAIRQSLYFENAYVDANSCARWEYGYSVRCIKDTSEPLIRIVDTFYLDIKWLFFTKVRNTGQVYIINLNDVDPIDISLVLNDTAAFSVVPKTATMAPGDSINVKINFTSGLSGNYMDTLHINTNNPVSNYSFICLSASSPQSDSIVDIRDGKVYNVVKIGENWWQQENLNVGNFINVTESGNNGIIEKYCYQNNPSNCIIYGGLYKWDEMMDYASQDDGSVGSTSGICPIGWHLPTENEWYNLVHKLGGANEAGGKLKEAGTKYWHDPNVGATNESGFTALPGSFLQNSKSYDSIGYAAYFWSATEKLGNPDLSRMRILRDYTGEVFPGNIDKETGASVRCLIATSDFQYLNLYSNSLMQISELEFNVSRTSDTIIVWNFSADVTVNLNSISTSTLTYNVYPHSAQIKPGDSIHLILEFNVCERGNDYLDTLLIESDDPYSPQIIIPLSGQVDQHIEEICMITIDPATGKNLIVWEKTPNKGVTSYNIYRETSVMGQYKLIGNVPFNQLSVFTDTSSNPEGSQSLYKISVIDSCGNESGKSVFHKPLFLQYVGSVGGVNLQWSDYEIEGGKVTFLTYEIYRGQNLNSLEKLTEISASLDRFTDADPEAKTENFYYRIAGVKQETCDPDGNMKSDTYDFSRSMSNFTSKEMVWVHYHRNESYLTVFPNPVNQISIIKFQNLRNYPYTLYIIDISGKVCRIIEDIGSEEFVLHKGNLQEGLYFIELRGPEIFRGKVVVE